MHKAANIAALFTAQSRAAVSWDRQALLRSYSRPGH